MLQECDRDDFKLYHTVPLLPNGVPHFLRADAVHAVFSGSCCSIL